MAGSKKQTGMILNIKNNYPVIILVLLIIVSLTGCPGKERQAGESPGKISPVMETGESPELPPSVSIETKGKDSLKPVLINPVDGAEMILIPGGDFMMGADDSDKDAHESEKPQHKVRLDDYYIYKYEVTNEQFEKFIGETGYKAEGNWEKWVTSGTGDYPVVMVSWNDATAYCKWAGVRLPTEAEWEKAARGGDGRIYPWGNNWDPTLCINKNTPNKLTAGKVRYLFEKTGILPIGFLPEGKSPYGIMNMGGNVREWCYDWFDEGYYENSPDKNPRGPDKGEDRVLRGGSFMSDVTACRTTAKEDNEPSSNDTDYGFRCAWDPSMPFPVPTKTGSPVILKGEPRSSPPPPSPEPPVDVSRLKKEKVNPKDGAEMILIPGGEFIMGASPNDPDARWEEKPAHRVWLDPYYIYKFEVTFGQFVKFAGETGYKSQGEWKKYFNRGTENHPVVYITWNDASAYSRWAGAKLPTEAQWELAARGMDQRIYPWGNKWNPDLCNNFELKDPALLKKRYIIYDDMGITAVGSFPGDKSPFGIMDMGGNVIEWCRDLYDPDYYKNSPYKNPLSKTGSQRVMRGGGWGQPRQVCRSGYRDRERSEDVDGDFGFRCIVEIEGEIKNISK